MNFTIFLVQKKWEDFYKKAIDEYTKRLSRYCKIKIISVKSNEALLKKIESFDFLIGIKASNKIFDSVELSEEIQSWANSGKSQVAFVISSELDFKNNLSISNMKMSSSLETVVLLEQIYRSFRILNNEPYHK